MGKVDENVPVTSQQASYELPPRFDHRHRRPRGHFKPTSILYLKVDICLLSHLINTIWLL